MPYDTIQEIRARLNQVAPNLTRYGLLEEANFFAQASELGMLSHKMTITMYVHIYNFWSQPLFIVYEFPYGQDLKIYFKKLYQNILFFSKRLSFVTNK